jgi:ABC-type arginine/histidine transport system permease subunit
MKRRAEQILPLALSLIGGWFAYSSVKSAIGKEISIYVELMIGAGLFFVLSIWLAKEAILGHRRAGWLTSAGILFYCMFRHMTPLIAQLFAYTFGQTYFHYVASYGEPATYLILAAFYALTGYLCLRQSRKKTHNQEEAAT